MEIVVSGSSGLIGSALVADLRGDGHRVRRLVRGRAPVGGDEVAWDPRSGAIDTEALRGTEGVVHLAGENIAAHRWSEAQKTRILESRIAGTSLLAAALAGLPEPPRVLISASAVGYYGDRGDSVLTEASPSGTDFQAEVCRQWEAATAPADGAGIRTVHIRTGIVLARHGGALARMLLPFRCGLGGRIGNGRQYMSWITLDDEVAAIRYLLGHEVVGPVNLTAPNPVTSVEFTTALGRALHRPTRMPTPLLPLKARYGTELVQTLLLGGQRVIPQALLDAGFEFTTPELPGALARVLGSDARSNTASEG